jgi:phosphopantothenoylcysteine decarboxylase/phosphopantothenate--cysteine ligase
MLSGKNIILGVCGSIAAYKAAFLVRLLVKERANVQVIMTPDAQSFITPLTLSTLSRREVLSAYFDGATGTWNNHVELGLWADYVLIAPASANTLAKFAQGMCDNLLTAVYLSARCPVYFAPAMDLDMWAHPATKANVARLQSYGNILIPPGTGELASGLSGDGRMAEPEDIVACLAGGEAARPAGGLPAGAELPFKGKKILITAGPTYEAIDPVRFIGNHSSGKMGYALSDTFARWGAEVTLVSGPSSLSAPEGVNRVNVSSAEEMLKACLESFRDADVVVMSAAVADYRPAQMAKQKIKKSDANLTIHLEKTTDILKTLGEQKGEKQVLVGFALETENELANAKDKLLRKNLDLIILNSLNDTGAGFAGDRNKVTAIDALGSVRPFELKSKQEVAEDIAKLILALLPPDSGTSFASIH